MKNGIIRQILALILAMIMIAGMLPAAFASDEAGYDVQGDAAAAQSVPEAGSGETKEISDKTEETETGSKTVYRAFDVSLQKDGEDLDVEGEFRVTVDTGLDVGSLVPEGAERTGVTFTLYHIHGDQVDIIEDAVVDENGILTFTTPNFSTFVLKYTVDFAFEAEDGTVYEFSIPGGGCISLYNLAEELGLAKDDPETEADEIQEFIDNIQDVTFSNPDLVFIGKADAYFTVGNIKEGVGLDCTYSEELTEEDIAAINSQIIKAGDWAVISLQPFTSDETLTITMKDGKTYTVQVTDAQLTKTVIDAKGDTWEITVTYDDSAEIPKDAELRVEEILPEDERYEQYYQQSLEKVGVIVVQETEEGGEVSADVQTEGTSQEANNSADTGINGYAHIFDIQIWDGDHEIQPASDVSVSIKLLDAPKSEDTSLQVVHFGKDGLEVMELAEDEDNAKVGETELNFMTDEFSVYSVVEVTNNNITTVLNDGPYALVTGIANDPGPTTGYQENWGQDYFTIIVNANAMSDTLNNNSLDPMNVHAWTEGNQGYVGGSKAELWYFDPVGNSQYYIYVLKNGERNYIINQGNNGIGLSTQNRTAFTITPNDDGTVLIHDGNWYLHNEGSGEWQGRRYTVSENVNTNLEANRFRLCKRSDDFDSCAAQKVSASTITTNTNYVIYRRFEDEDGIESLYALAHDGTFVRVYDGGDTIYWRETDKNIYWNFQMAGYPVLFTQDPSTHETIYINPSHSAGQTLSTTTEGLTLLGRDNGAYSTAIECWDQGAYDYAGLHVNLSNDGTATLTTGTRIDGTDDEFLFAVARTFPGATAETVATVDSLSLGIEITMFDYGDPDGHYNAGDKLEGMTTAIGPRSDDYTPHAAHSLVIPYMLNGMPVSKLNGSELSALFSVNGSEVTNSITGVNHLFLQSYYDESGTFRYRSEDNYAYIDIESGSNNFTVYRQAATPYTTDYSPGHTYYNHGHYMPFNDIDMNNNLSRLMNQYGNAYVNGEIIGELPLEDGRTYEDIYGIQGTPNYYTGMKMEAEFYQPRDGILENGDEMIYQFTGDDDMWVYIDDVLVLDVGGIHEPLTGKINFTTGVVTNPVGSSLEGTTTLKQIFMDVYNDPNTPQPVRDKIDSIEWDGDTFAAYSNHTVTMFYMERGAGASNLDLQFNLKVTLPDQFTIKKDVPEEIDPRFVNQEYKFRATFIDDKDSFTEKPLHDHVQNSAGAWICNEVVYKDRTGPNGEEVPVTFTQEEDGWYYFYMRANEEIIFRMVDESTYYRVYEVAIDPETNTGVDIGETVIPIMEGYAASGLNHVHSQSYLHYINHPVTQNLLLTKHLTVAIPEGENPVFEFRVYIESIQTDQYGNPVLGEDGKPVHLLVPYSQAPYQLIKEIEGEVHYFKLTGENNAPVDQGTTPVTCSTTGRSGSINSIPPEYTVVIPNLVVGTNFYVEERRDNIPTGYEFDHEELTPDTYDESTLIQNGASAAVINRVLARDETDLQEFDPNTVGQIKKGVDAESHMYNTKPISITVKKVSKDQLDAEDPQTLQGAAFKIEKYTDNTFLVKDETWGDQGVKSLEDVYNNGTFSFEGLKRGFYKIVETASPDGYVKISEDPIFEIRLNSETKKLEVILLNQDKTDAENNQLELLRVKDFTILFGNPPGIELPKTGGQGTELFTILGGMITAAAGAVLLRRRKRQTKNN